MTGPRDAAAERARLEEIAYGPAASPADAARARIALADQAAGRRGYRTHVEARSDPGGPVAVPREDGPVGTTPGATPDGAVATTSGAASGGPAATTLGAAPDGDGDEPGRDDQGDPGLQADDAAGRRWSLSSARRGWLVAGAAAVVAVAFASGIAVGAVHPAQQPAAPPSPTDGAVTLTQLLDAPQTFADRLPGPLEVPVSVRTTRLVFTNRSLAGDDAGTPWNVWAGVGRDASQICLIASADRIQATAACYPEDAVLRGSVSLTAESSGGVLQVRAVGGVVRGTVTGR